MGLVGVSFHLAGVIHIRGSLMNFEATEKELDKNYAQNIIRNFLQFSSLNCQYPLRNVVKFKTLEVTEYSFENYRSKLKLSI